MQHHHHGTSTLVVQSPHQLQHVHLVGQVEVGGRLIEQQQVGALGQRHGQPGALPLAAGELVEGAVGEVLDAGHAQRLGHRRLVIRGPLPVPGLVRVPPARDQVGDGQPFRGHRGLREHPEHLGHFLGGHLVDLLAVQQHAAAPRSQQPSQRAQQRRLAAAIRADHRGYGAVHDVEVQTVDDDPVAVGQLKVAGVQPLPVTPLGRRGGLGFAGRGGCCHARTSRYRRTSR